MTLMMCLLSKITPRMQHLLQLLLLILNPLLQLSKLHQQLLLLLRQLQFHLSLLAEECLQAHLLKMLLLNMESTLHQFQAPDPMVELLKPTLTTLSDLVFQHKLPNKLLLQSLHRQLQVTPQLLTLTCLTLKSARLLQSVSHSQSKTSPITMSLSKLRLITL
jgi:hypothetical protein